MNEVGVVIDMGGTMIKIGLVADGKLLAHTKVDAESRVNLEQRLQGVGDVVEGLLREHGLTPTGVGVAFPGIVDAGNKKILSRYVKYPDAQDFDLSAWAHRRWGVPLAVENDARAALMGEWQYGAGQQCDNLVLVTLGTGFGSAVLIDGKLLRGRNHVAGNLGGHMTLNVHGSTCNCGNIGCLETECSAWALEDYVRRQQGFAGSALAREQEITFKAVFAGSREGNALAKEVLAHCLKVWSLGIISLIHAYDPERIIIGGGIMKSQDVIIPAVREMVATHSWVKDNVPEIVPAVQTEFAGVLGMYHALSTLGKGRHALKGVSAL
ncbi:ROK family protein [Dawidia soli]|uniref:ROK family protein n=1 Tax=Dawidia soli TaxID=2782352 RepID=A0AAP2DER2_9BACT|nr:ROK family protein [Dawidia soli]MBT1688032.1 ROK family protein [Dawidia soli]